MKLVSRGGVFQQLAVPLSIFVLLASLGLALWLTGLHRRSSMQRFREMAETNAGFMSALPLPRSAEMAGKLSSILGVGVGFRAVDGGWVASSEAGWPVDLTERLAGLDASGVVSFEAGDFDLAVAPLQDARHHLVLVRPEEGGVVSSSGLVVGPVLVLTAGCGCLVFFLSHRIVRPLDLLTRWLPNLDQGEDAPEPVPAAVSKRKDEIGLLARALEDVHHRLVVEQERRRLSERMAALGHVATRLAHEVRNPAAAIRMHADLLASCEGEGEASSLASVSLIREEVDRITDLVNQWLFVAQGKPPELRRQDLKDLLQTVVDRLEPALHHAGASVHVHDSGGSAEVLGDRLRLEQVIRNLLVNSIQAMPRGGAIRVHLGGSGERVEMTVADSGAGFTEEALRRFGEPFFSEKEGGMGIGLTLSREVIEGHHGTIAPTNSEDGGAVVRLSLPAAGRSSS